MKDNKLAIKDEKLKKYFQEKFHLTENIAKPMVSLPILSLVHAPQGEPKIVDGKIVKEINGKDVEVGSFYHSETKKAYKNPKIVILDYIKALLPRYGVTLPHNFAQLSYNEKKQYCSHNEIVGGFLPEDNAPFMFFFKSMALRDWWDFNGKLAQASKDSMIPTYAIIAEFSTGKRDSMDGKYKNIMYPKLTLSNEVVDDMKLLKLIEGGIEKTREGLQGFVEFKNGEFIGGKSEKLSSSDRQLSQARETEAEEGEEVDINDVPDFVK